MSRFITTRLFWTLLTVCLVGVFSVSPGKAATWYWGAHPDKERLVVAFDRPLASYSLSRTGTQALTLTLPFNSGALSRQSGSKDPAAMQLLRSPLGGSQTITIRTSTPAFGYIASVVSGNKLVIDVFNDPIGRRWKPAKDTAPKPEPKKPAQAQQPRQTPKEPAAPKPPKKAENTATPKKQSAKKVTPAKKQGRTPVVEKPGSRDLTPSLPPPVKQAALPTPAPEPVSNASQAPVPVVPASPAPVINSSSQRSYFAVPYSFRSNINSGGPEEWQEAPTQPAAKQVQQEKPFKGVRGRVNNAPQVWQQPATQNPAKQAVQPAPQEQPKVTQSVSPPQSTAPSQQTVAQSVPSTGSGQRVRARVAQPGESVVVQGGQPIQTTAPAELAKPTSEGEERARFQVSEQVQQAEPFPEQATPIPQEEPVEQVTPIEPPKQELEEVVSNVPEPEAPPVVYVDADGNPIPPPPSPKELLFQAKAAFNNGEVSSARDIFERLKRNPELTEEQREDVLYGIADAAYSLGKNDLIVNFDDITNTITEAMNYNLKSDKVPSALLRLGLVNLRTGNLGEAQAYFNILRKKYPNDEAIPMSYYHWGDHYFKKGDWQKAADNFQYVVQNYPDSRFVREAGVGLARALYRLGFYDQSYQIVDFVEKRWPRFYVEYPPFLNIMGDVAYRKKEYETARTRYWTYYNIDPNGDEADLILARLGDIYLMVNEKPSAREVYEEAARKFPDRDGGLISLMRLAEEGIHDTPSISDMFTVFERPYNLRPLQIYSQIIEDHPDSELVPLARLKKAMWYLWNKEYPKALSTATAFGKKHPGHPLEKRIKEVALRAFNVMVADNISEGNYERILQIWEQFPIVQGQEEELAPESRIALGLSYSEKDQPSQALKVIDPFFQGLKVPEYSEMALNLALSIYLENERWDDIIKLAQRVELWELNDNATHELEYAKALALENLSKPDMALPIWQTLQLKEDIPLTQEANIFYFLARDAQRAEQYDEAYKSAEQALRSFKDIARKEPEKADVPKIKDMLSMLMDVTETTGRARESLNWAREYAQYVKPGDPDYPSMRYRLARLYRKNTNIEKWRTILTELKDQNPDSLYGRMAASELKSQQLTEGASQFSPTGKL